MKAFKAFIYNLRVANKMMVIYIVGGLIPLLFLSFYQTGYARNLLIEQATEEAFSHALRNEERIQDVCRIAANVSDGFYLDEDLQRITSTLYSDQFTLINALNDYTRIDDYLRLYPELDSIRIYVPNKTLLNNSKITPTTEQYKRTDWYQLAQSQEGKIEFIYRYDEIKQKSFLALVRLIKGASGEEIGVLVVNISNRTLKRIFDETPYKIIGVIDQNQIVISTEAKYEGMLISEDYFINQMFNQSLNNEIFDDETGKYKVINTVFQTQNSGNHISLLTLIPTTEFTAFANQVLIRGGALVFVSVCAALILVSILTRTLTERIEKFRFNLHKVATGDFDLEESIAGKDEIALLYSDLEVTTKSIKDLIYQVYEVELQKEQMTSRQREVEFKMLTSQIDPHFLYNTLETIRMESLLNDQHEIASIVKKLASIMRRKLSVLKEEVSLNAELGLLRDYLDIQAFRFRDRVTYTIDKKCDTSSFMVLPLLLQPIVENAFVHGLEKKVGKGEIRIKIDEDDAFLLIEISDNGRGMNAETLSTINSKLEKDVLSFKGSIGLTNVYQRIKLFYQHPYTMNITSELEKGTIVTLLLPKHQIN
ncbi:MULTISPECIES: sensor histidine kinase [unclassified Fusibacter]|uniref:sensor histidine kinase n=1 Tax=unclassified Fusibacter TaxID=2624464 RepID=UPI0010124D54|nr:MULTISPECIES: sensor histidine kinase [unclassified Fusibacter]MCK8061670.1 sensor histidine kinase [Fusibacter sp. A2]NPE23854.1 sensor histidine kinase [Fusibacter sp. A1]RXV58569.1 sensor histidine kinase [Fusibacter sp. A1]